MEARLTTHVLDIAQGKPAVRMHIELWSIDAQDSRTLLRQATTNADGRVDAPLLSGEEMRSGIYELVFSVGDYFAHTSVALPDPPFLDRVTVRFGVADPAEHYHVPLLVSPWAYSTYRGS